MPVKAPADGVVTLAHPDMYFSGATLIIDHGHGLSSTFLHLDSIEVAVGQRVRQDEVVARLGKSGRVTGPHLDRSEEHTSELQSLMRISYAVFCLKKQNTIHKYNK